jgi:anaerobic magnesium-protoporphyrin IX monomethyl ester cyclase
MAVPGGQMRVLLAGPDYEENLSIRYLSSSLLDAGHDTTLATFNSPADTRSVAGAAQGAGIVGLSMCFQSRAQEFLRLAQLIRSHDPKRLIVAGGHYASCAAEPLLAHHPELDIIVIHEGERTLVEIADAMPHLEARLPQIPGIAYRVGQQVRFTPQRRTSDDLDALPFPDRRGPIHVIAGVPTNYMMGSRGCYGSCAYCCITTLHQLAPGKRFRQRNVERIADEMAALYHERGTRQFVFHDDNFLVPSQAINHARLSAFEKALKKRGVQDIALVVKCRPGDAKREVLRRLKDLGLVRVFLGVESATASGLSDLERSQSVEDSERALDTCFELGISAQFTLMVFHPDATLDTLRSDLAFMRRFCGNPLNFCRAEIYAGTPLEKRMIELGRARGDYLARVYNLSDPVANLACNISLELFESRCWSNGSLMQSAIGLDHLASVRKRFDDRPSGRALCERVDRWLRSVNLDTTGLLEEVIELSASNTGRMDAGVQSALLSLQQRESITRRELLSQGSNLRAELETFHFPNQASEFNQPPGVRVRLARQLAAAVLAIAIPATAGCQSGVSEMAPPPLKEAKTPPLPSGTDQETLCSLAGTVTDAQGAVVLHVAITITNLDTGLTRTLTTSAAGQYEANDLPSGRYSVRAQAPGFSVIEKTGIVLKAGDRERADIRLQVFNPGCCEYAAGPLKVEELTLREKPFTYMVGDAKDHNSFQGIAKQVYGDSKAWVQIFEVNRNVVEKPGFIADGTSILIPPKKRAVPKLISRVMPVYPPSAEKEHVQGDVLLDVTLNEDGTVEGISLIDGNPLLVEAATSAVKQWRYQPLLVKGKPVAKFVVVISFGKRVKTQ